MRDAVLASGWREACGAQDAVDLDVGQGEPLLEGEPGVGMVLALGAGDARVDQQRGPALGSHRLHEVADQGAADRPQALLQQPGHGTRRPLPAQFGSGAVDPLDELAEICEDLGMVDPLLLQSTVIFKQSFTGAEIRDHQDASYLYTEPSSVLGASWSPNAAPRRLPACALARAPAW